MQALAGGVGENAVPSARPAGNTARMSVRGHPVTDAVDSVLWNRELGAVPEENIVALVQQLFSGIRDYLVQAAEMKFNCFFLMPVIDEFPTKLREEVEAAFEANLEDVFDVVSVLPHPHLHRLSALLSLAE